MATYTRRQSKLQERRTARDVGGREQPGSGSQFFAKGDVRKAGDLRLECKTTSGSKYSLKKSDLKKIEREAQSALEEWGFQIQFQQQSGMGKKFAVMDYRTFMDRLNVTHRSAPIFLNPLIGGNSQVSVSLDKLIEMQGEAEKLKSIGFTTVSFGMDTRMYVICTWELFQELRESSNV